MILTAANSRKDRIWGDARKGQQDLNPPFGVRHSRKSCFGLCPLQEFWVNDGANFSDARFRRKESLKLKRGPFDPLKTIEFYVC